MQTKGTETLLAGLFNNGHTKARWILGQNSILAGVMGDMRASLCNAITSRRRGGRNRSGSYIFDFLDFL